MTELLAWCPGGLDNRGLPVRPPVRLGTFPDGRAEVALLRLEEAGTFPALDYGPGKPVIIDHLGRARLPGWLRNTRGARMARLRLIWPEEFERRFAAEGRPVVTEEVYEIIHRLEAVFPSVGLAARKQLEAELLRYADAYAADVSRRESE